MSRDLRRARSSDTSDADEARYVARLRLISQLEHSISGRQLDLEAARQRRDSARRALAAPQAALARVEAAIEDLERHVHRRAEAVFLDGAALDRGALLLRAETIHYSGWRGQVRARLEQVRAVEVGTSFLPPRAGVPILERLRPGVPRVGGTLLISLAENAPGDERSAESLIVIADLRDPTGWRDAILDRRRRLGEVSAERARLLVERQRAVEAAAAASAPVDAAQSQVGALEAEIAQLRGQLESVRKRR